MDANALAAAKAYLNTATTVAAPAGGEIATPKPDGGFAGLVRDAVDGAVETGKMADTQMQNLVSGSGNMVDVVTAIAETEATVQTMVSVRDRMISAYQEVLNMPV